MAPQPIQPAAVGASAEQAEVVKQRRPLRRRWPVVAAAITGALAALYALDLLTSGDIPRDVVVAGVDIGGMDRADAEKLLRTQLEPRLTKPVHVVADGAGMTVDPATARVTADWDATLDVAAQTSYNPWRRLQAFFVDRPVDVVATGDQRAIAGRLATLAKRVDRPRVEGDIRFTGAEPSTVLPVAGKRLDVPQATRTVITRWAEGGPIHLPVDRLGVKATPETIGGLLAFTSADDGTLAPGVDARKLQWAARKDVAKAETKAKDARVRFGKKATSVVPSVNGHEVDWDAAAERLVDVLRKPGDRTVELPFRDTPAKLTTEQLKGRCHQGRRPVAGGRRRHLPVRHHAV